MSATLADLPGDWRFDAACNPLIAYRFFPDQGKGEPTAKEVCHSCYVQEACLAYALANHEPWGTWGGLTSHERRALVHPEATS